MNLSTAKKNRLKNRLFFFYMFYMPYHYHFDLPSVKYQTISIFALL